jgi:hypothetical protein
VDPQARECAVHAGPLSAAKVTGGLMKAAAEYPDRMGSAAGRSARLLAALMSFPGALIAVLLPTSSWALAAGLIAVVLTIVIATTIGSARLMPVGAGIGMRTRAVLQRLVPRAAQSDPDARGHARPRGPGILLPAV